MKVTVQYLLIATLLAASCRVKVCAHGGFDEEIKLTDSLIAASPNDGQHWYHRAYLNFLHGDWQIALSDSEKAERLAPGKFPVDWLRAQALAAGDQLDVALTVISDFMNAHPGHPGGLVVRGRILNKLKRSELALADFREALARMPNAEPDLYLEVVDALQAQHCNEDAAQVLATGIAKLGNIPGLVLKALDLEIAIGRIDLALTRVDAMQNKAPRPEPWMARRASILAKSGRVDEARTAWQTLADHLAKLPNLERGSHAMSVLAEESQKALAELKPSANPDEAKPHAPAVQVTQTDPKMMFPSRSVLGPGSKYEEELDRMDRLILQEPANALYRFQRGELNLLDGKWKWAREDCEEAERLAPGKFPVDRLQAQILDGEGKLTAAKTLLDRCISANPQDSIGYAARARVHMKLERVEKALSDYRSALANQATPEANLFLEVANALRANGRKEEAVKILTRALELHKEEPTLVTQALELEASMGAFDAALTKVESMQKTSPRPELWMAKKAALLDQAGRKEESRAAWLELQQRIAALPNLERGTQPLCTLSEQAAAALASSQKDAPTQVFNSSPVTVSTAPVSLPPSP